ncbi:VOC family protein [Deinococcus hohokamensis]|uniref:VOC family protein n=1 Tax=Deinococcus hohokamensis TaxID=309883 RepID=A0ABV9I9K0_9DEIO
MHLRHLTLPTREFAAQRAFYTRTLGLSPCHEGPGTLSVQTGTSRLTLQHDDSTPGYLHLAWDIPAPQLDAAEAWLRARVPLLADEEGHTRFPPAEEWNTTSLYFEDPAGNILEFVARHDQRSPASGAFGPHSLRRLSELGLVVPDVARAAGQLEQHFGLRAFNGQSPTFTPVGGHDGMLIVVPEGRGWFPVRRPAVPAPFALNFDHAGHTQVLTHQTLGAPAPGVTP